MLMDPHRAAVDHLHIAIVGLADGGHHAIPNPGFAPADKAVVAGGIGTEFLLRQSPPWCARPQHPENPVQHPPVVHPRHPPRLVRQQRRDDTPFEIRQLISLHDPAPPVGKLESHLDSRGYPFYVFHGLVLESRDSIGGVWAFTNDTRYGG